MLKSVPRISDKKHVSVCVSKCIGVCVTRDWPVDASRRGRAVAKRSCHRRSTLRSTALTSLARNSRNRPVNAHTISSPASFNDRPAVLDRKRPGGKMQCNNPKLHFFRQTKHQFKQPPRRLGDFFFITTTMRLKILM